jgi:hypothetical protein
MVSNRGVVGNTRQRVHRNRPATLTASHVARGPGESIGRPAILCGVDVVLSVPLFVGVALVALFALVVLRQTRLFWFPGLALIAYGIAIYLVWPWYETGHDGAMFGGLSNFLHVAASFLVVTGGVVFVLVGARSRLRARRARPAELPTAVVMRSSAKP